VPTRLPTVQCSARELAYLASLLGAESLIGVPDPFAGWSAAATEEGLAEARSSLADRRLITLLPDGSLALEETTAELVGTCGFAEATFLLTYTSAEGAAVSHHFHAIQRSAVELVLSQEAHLSCRLTALDTDQILGRVCELFRLGAQPAPPVPNGRLAGSALRKARHLAESGRGEAAAAWLCESGLRPETAAALAETLAAPVGNGALVAMSSDQSELGVDGLALLEGENGLWLLRNVPQDGVQWVDAVPCTAESLREFIRSVMNRALPGLLL
jgi:hypothetical protein